MWGQGERRGCATPSLRVVKKGAGSEASKKGGFKAKGRGKREASDEWQGQDERGGTLSKLWTSVLTQGSCPEARPKLGGAQMEGMAGLWDEVCVPAAERPTPLSTPPTHPRGLGLGTDLKASRTGKACPGWMRFVASAEPCPLWVCSHSTVLVASS